MPKSERALNPAAAQHKKDKASALKKSRAAVAAQRATRLATRDPARLQRQIDDLTALREASGGQLRPRDKQQLEQLERDVKAIRKAREAKGVPEGRTPSGRDGDRDKHRRQDGHPAGHGGRNANFSVLGKRRRGGEDNTEQGADGDSDGAETDPEVRAIPMPRDTPPPLPAPARQRRTDWGLGEAVDRPVEQERQQRHELPARPQAPAQTTYSAAPQTRNLVKEAAAAFVPAAVAARIKERKGGVGGKLLEEDEVRRLERGGYLPGGGVVEKAAGDGGVGVGGSAQTGAGTRGLLDDEEARFERELREVDMSDDKGDAGGAGTEGRPRSMQVEMEEVEDEDA